MTTTELSEHIKSLRQHVSRLRKMGRDADDTSQACFTEASHVEGIANDLVNKLRAMEELEKSEVCRALAANIPNARETNPGDENY